MHSDLTHEAIAVADQEFICRPREAWEGIHECHQTQKLDRGANTADIDSEPGRLWVQGLTTAPARRRRPRTIRVAGATQLFGADLLSSRTFNSVAERCRAQGPVIACRGLRAATSGTGRSGGQRMAGRQRTCSECRASDLAIYIERQ